MTPGMAWARDVANYDKCFLLKLVDVVELELARLGFSRARVAACQREMRLIKCVGKESKACYVRAVLHLAFWCREQRHVGRAVNAKGQRPAWRDTGGTRRHPAAMQREHAQPLRRP